MTTVSRVNTVTHSNVSSGGGDWDHRLNRLLEDLQETVVPPDTKRNATEYREYRMYSSSKTNDQPAQTTEEKWVEYGARHPTSGGHTSHRLPALTDSAYSSNNITSSRERTVNFSDDNFGPSFVRPSAPVGAGAPWGDTYSSTNKVSQMEFLTPANTTTVLKSGPSSPAGGVSSIPPKVERKEYYAKASYTSLIKGAGGGPGDLPPGFDSIDKRSERLLDEIIPHDALPDYSRPPGPTTSSVSETRRTYTSETTRGSSGVPDAAPPAIGAPLYSSTPLKPSSSSSYTREVITDRSVTPPPPVSEGLKTPPLVRKILQSSSSTSNYHSSSKNVGGPGPYDSTTPLCARPPLGGAPGPIPNYDEPPEPRGARYYTSTTTRTEHRENREISPVKRFPSPQPPRGDNYGEPPKRLDELLATFEDSSYTETRRITGDGGGPHKPHPYGPGTHPVEPVRQVRIDDNVTQRTIVTDEEPELHQRKNATNYQNPAYSGKEVEPTRNVAGPPVFYPSSQVFPKTEEEALMANAEGGKGKMKAKRKAGYEAKEKMKQSHSEDKGGGVVPIPVCLPVCCAAPCTIM